ncbi:hypothetical protein AcV5_010136 [Taiwanofungus camphoratus]|nr:hypothetical protein AcV5_010136 [Antrodia cinnamomea]
MASPGCAVAASRRSVRALQARGVLPASLSALRTASVRFDTLGRITDSAVAFLCVRATAEGVSATASTITHHSPPFVAPSRIPLRRAGRECFSTPALLISSRDRPPAPVSCLLFASVSVLLQRYPFLAMPSAQEPLYVDYGLPLFHGYQQLSDAVSSLAAPVALVPRLSLTSHFLNSPSLASPFELASKWQLDGTATSLKHPNVTAGANSRVEAHNGELLTRPAAPSSTCRHASAEHQPVAMRGSDSERAERGDDGLWALHEEACAGLALSCPSFCVASDFQAPEKARPFRLDEADGGFACSGADWQWKGQHSGRQRFEIAMHGLDGAAGVFDGAGGAYTISSNPPKAKTSFRIGDWICTVPNCAAHNFG